MYVRTARCLAILLAMMFFLLLLILPANHSSAADEARLYLPLLFSPAGPPTSGVIAATYLGGEGNDSSNEVGIGSDGSIVVAGTWPGYNPGNVTATTLLDGGDAALLRIAADGQRVRSLTRIGATISDMEIAPAGTIAVCGDFGVAMLSTDASTLMWSANPAEIGRCAIGSDGSVAALAGNTVYLYAANGTMQGNWPVGGTARSDIAVDGANELVFVTGYSQKASNLKVAFLFAFDYSGITQWTAYDFAASAVQNANLGADSEGRRLAIGGDGKLYFAGKVDGGNAIFTRDPHDISRSLSGNELIKIDNYSNPFNISGAKSLSWYGRFEPVDGRLLLSQWMLTRLSSGSGNSIGITAIAADANGNVFLAGGAFATIKDRDNLVFAGSPVGSYEGNEPYFAAINSDFRSRRVWTVFAAPGSSAGASPASGVAVRDGIVAIAATLNPGNNAQRELITYAALQAVQTATNTSEGYCVIWRLP